MEKEIKATISQAGISKLPFFFDQTFDTVLKEVLQNSRRAGAKSVQITTSDTSKSGSLKKIVIEDDGKGISDFADLLNFLHSGWNSEMQDMEGPAGLGFFALNKYAKNDILISSRGYSVVLTEDTFLGREAARVTEDPYGPAQGTRVEFYVDATSSEFYFGLHDAIKAACEYYPVPVTLDGKDLEVKSFLNACDYVHHCEYADIGVTKVDIFDATHSAVCNFKGVNFIIPNAVPGGIRDAGIKVHVDIHSSRAVDMILPDRKNVVQNEKLEDLKNEMLIAVFNYINKVAPDHELSYAMFDKAREVGFEIPEAKFCLRKEQVLPSARGYCWRSGSCSCFDIPNHEIPRGMAVNLIEDSQVLRAIAIANGFNQIPHLYQKSDNHAWYSWYPKTELIEVTQIAVLKTGVEKEIDLDDGYYELEDARRVGVERAYLRVTIGQNVGSTQVIEMPTKLLFVGVYSGDTGDVESVLQNCWLYVGPKEELGNTVDEDDLFNILFEVPSEQNEDEALEEFMKAARIELLRQTCGETAALERKIRESVIDLTWDFKHCGLKQIVVNVHPETGKLETINLIKNHE